MANAILTQSELKSQLHYDPESGIFTWIKPKFGITLGRQAGYLTNGYVGIGFNGKYYKAHRLAWLYMTGKMPDYEIDHIDGNKSNNSFINLRDVRHEHNAQNERKFRKSNKSKLLGVCYKAKNRKFTSQIGLTVNGVRKNYYLGLFDTAELAHEAYLRKKREIHDFSTI